MVKTKIVFPRSEREAVQYLIFELWNLNGGLTTSKGKGYWVDTASNLHEEKVTIFESASFEPDKVKEIALKAGSIGNQKAVYIEIDNVPQVLEV